MAVRERGHDEIGLPWINERGHGRIAPSPWIRHWRRRHALCANTRPLTFPPVVDMRVDIALMLSADQGKNWPGGCGGWTKDINRPYGLLISLGWTPTGKQITPTANAREKS